MAASRARALGSMSRALYLGGIPALSALEPDDLAQVADHVHECSFSRGEVLSRQDAPIHAAHILVEGVVRAAGEGRKDALLGPRDSLGLLSLLAQSPLGLAATAETDCLTLALEGDTLRELLEDNFALLLQLLRHTAEQTLELRRQIAPETLLATRPDLVPCPDRGLDLVERIVLLRERGPFRRVSLDALADVAAQMQEVRAASGERLWRSGDPSGHTLLLLSGTVRCGLQDRDYYFRCGTGYPLGNVESLAQRPRWFDAEAETPLVALRAETDGFLDVLEDHFDMAQELLAEATTNLIRLLEEEREGAAGYSLEDRTAASPEP